MMLWEADAQKDFSTTGLTGRTIVYSQTHAAVSITKHPSVVPYLIALRKRIMLIY